MVRSGTFLYAATRAPGFPSAPRSPPRPRCGLPGVRAGVRLTCSAGVQSERGAPGARVGRAPAQALSLYASSAPSRSSLRAAPRRAQGVASAPARTRARLGAARNGASGPRRKWREHALNTGASQGRVALQLRLHRLRDRLALTYLPALMGRARGGVADERYDTAKSPKLISFAEMSSRG